MVVADLIAMKVMMVTMDVMVMVTVTVMMTDVVVVVVMVVSVVEWKLGGDDVVVAYLLLE